MEWLALGLSVFVLLAQICSYVKTQRQLEQLAVDLEEGKAGTTSFIARRVDRTMTQHTAKYHRIPTVDAEVISKYR